MVGDHGEVDGGAGGVRDHHAEWDEVFVGSHRELGRIRPGDHSALWYIAIRHPWG